MSNSFLDKRISTLVAGQFPEFTREQAGDLIKFIEKYYEWLETVSEVGYQKRKLEENFDVDRASERFLDFLKNEFLKNLPRDLQVDQRTLLKYVQDFFASKGSEKSFRFLFRIIFNEEIDFYNPADDILRASDGQWVVERYLKVQTPFPVEDLTGQTIKGVLSKARARVERVERYLENGVEFYYYFYSNKINEFQLGESLIAADNTERGVIKEDVTMPGRYISTRGHVSSDKYLQDNFFYQEYSYVINSQQPINVIKPVVDQLVHPSGTIFFNQYFTFSTLDPFHNFFEGTTDLFLQGTFIDLLSPLLEDLIVIIDRAFVSLVDQAQPTNTNFRLDYFGNLDTGTISSSGNGVVTGVGTTFDLYAFRNNKIVVYDPVSNNTIGLFNVEQVNSNTQIIVNTSVYSVPFTNARYFYEKSVFVLANGDIWALHNNFQDNANLTFAEVQSLTLENAMNLDHIVGRETEFTVTLAPGSFLFISNPISNNLIYTKRVLSVTNNTVLSVDVPFTENELNAVPVKNAKYSEPQNQSIEEVSDEFILTTGN